MTSAFSAMKKKSRKPTLARLLALHHTGPPDHPLTHKPNTLIGDGNKHTDGATKQTYMDNQYDGEWGPDGAAGP